MKPKKRPTAAQRKRQTRFDAAMLMAMGLTPELSRVLKARSEALRELMAARLEDNFSAPYPDGNAPGHCHRNPPKWDDQPGDCRWCKAWFVAEQVMKGPP